MTRGAQHDAEYVALTSSVDPAVKRSRNNNPFGFDVIRNMPVSQSAVVISTDHVAPAHRPASVRP